MTVEITDIDWENPEAVESMLADEGLWVIDWWINEKVNSTINISDENIEYEKVQNYIYFYFNNKIVWFIQYFAKDGYLQFIWNINGCNWNLEEYVENPITAWVFNNSCDIEIRGLWRYMLEIFFTEFCERWQKIKMRIENPNIRSILDWLSESDFIDKYYETNDVPIETIVEV